MAKLELWGKGSFTVLSAQNTEIIPLLLFIKFCMIFHANQLLTYKVTRKVTWAEAVTAGAEVVCLRVFFLPQLWRLAWASGHC